VSPPDSPAPYFTSELAFAAALAVFHHDVRVRAVSENKCVFETDDAPNVQHVVEQLVKGTLQLDLLKYEQARARLLAELRTVLNRYRRANGQRGSK
jgi:hypothetical protein